MAAAADDDDAAVAGVVISRRRSGAVPCFGACFGGGSAERNTTTSGSRSRMMTKTKKEGNKKKIEGGRSASLSRWRLIRGSKAYPGWKSQRTVPVDATVTVVVDVQDVKSTAELRRISGDEATAVHGGGDRGRKAKNRAGRPHSDQPPKPADAHAPATSKPATCHGSASFGPRKPAPAASPDHRNPARSVSFPAPGQRKLHPASGNFGDLDPVVGMSVLIVALAVLLLWGRLCAVFCTAAWFYFLPRIRKETPPTDPKLGTGGSPDMDSQEYKKKVVMEGLLERSHRSTAAIL